MRIRTIANHARVSKRKFFGVAAVLAMGLLTLQPLGAINYDAEINKLKSEVGNLDGRVGDLQIQGATLEEAMRNLEAQIRQLQNQIAKNEAKQDELTQKIATAKTNLAKREAALEQNLRQMYIDSDISDLEMVASSGTISELIDKQEYRSSIQESVATAMDEIRQIKKQLEGQKKQVEQLIRDDQAMQQQVSAKKASKADLLAKTRGKEKQFQSMIGEKKEEIEKLQAEQAAAIAAAAAQANSRFISQGGGGGGYPYGGVSMFPCQGDPWGMCMRQCVSYTAWKVAATGRHMPFWGGHGNANQWPGNAQAAGIATGSTPRAGAIAVMMGGPYGHTMYVEEVLSGGSQIRISEYNFAWDGTYSERIQSSSGLVYIYF